MPKAGFGMTAGKGALRGQASRRVASARGRLTPGKKS
jgi:hypothetical protein